MRVSILAVALILSLACARNGRRTPEAGNGNLSVATPESEGGRNDATDSNEKQTVVPVEFKDVDFKNFDYVTSLRGRIRLQNGEFEYAIPRGGGGDRFELADVHYADLTGDGKEEAVVDLHQVSCGASCDGGSHLFYFYSIKDRRPVEFWRFETGSLAYGCGLKSLVMREGQMTLEVFTSCLLKGRIMESGYDPYATSGGKYYAASFTRFKFEFNGKRFEMRNRELLPFPQNDARNYEAQVSVTQ